MNFSEEEIEFFDYKLEKDIKIFKEEDLKPTEKYKELDITKKRKKGNMLNI